MSLQLWLSCEKWRKSKDFFNLLEFSDAADFDDDDNDDDEDDDDNDDEDDDDEEEQ